MLDIINGQYPRSGATKEIKHCPRLSLAECHGRQQDVVGQHLQTELCVIWNHEKHKEGRAHRESKEVYLHRSVYNSTECSDSSLKL